MHWFTKMSFLCVCSFQKTNMQVLSTLPRCLLELNIAWLILQRMIDFSHDEFYLSDESHKVLVVSRFTELYPPVWYFCLSLAKINTWINQLRILLHVSFVSKDTSTNNIHILNIIYPFFNFHVRSYFFSRIYYYISMGKINNLININSLHFIF